VVYSVLENAFFQPRFPFSARALSSLCSVGFFSFKACCHDLGYRYSTSHLRLAEQPGTWFDELSLTLDFLNVASRCLQAFDEISIEIRGWTRLELKKSLVACASSLAALCSLLLAALCFASLAGSGFKLRSLPLAVLCWLQLGCTFCALVASGASE
jgi:hypothetical protein